MAKVPKHRRLKRATVLIKRTRCIRNTKNKTYPPLYQKLKINNSTLARALSQEKQENQLLFSRNVELLAEVQELAQTCNNHNLVIRNIQKNAKDMMQILVTMSSFLTNTISMCQEYISNQVNTRISSGSKGRRESSSRISTKSPARGVVKPMVSGHTITKPTINLSRVNMQRLQNVNLSIIEEGPSTPERNTDRSVESRQSQRISERLPVSTLRNDDNEERVIVNRRASRFSRGRLSSERYSKRNSARLSGEGITGRLSKRRSEYNELIKSPRVALQDVSRYLTNNQTINIRSLSETTRISNANNVAIVEDTQGSDQISPENLNHNTVIPETQESCETSESEQETNNTVRKKSSISIKSDKKSMSKKFNNRSQVIESHLIDPLEGPSWMYNSTLDTEEETALNNEVSMEQDQEQQESSPPMFSTDRRRTFSNMSGSQKSLTKITTSKLNHDDSPYTTAASSNNSLDAMNSSSNDDDEDDHRVNLHFITQRRGVSAKSPIYNNLNDDNEDDELTLKLNMQRQMTTPQAQPLEQLERLQFDLNELLQLTPLKPLLNINDRTENAPVQVDIESEPTATVQLTQKYPKPVESTDTFSQMTTIKISQNGAPDLPSLMTIRCQEPTNDSHDKNVRLSSKIELPRLSDVGLNSTEDNYHQTQMILTPESNKHYEIKKRKSMVIKSVETRYSVSEDNEEELAMRKNKKPKQRKKKSEDKNPSAVKVVLQKLNDTHRVSLQNESSKSLRKNSNESTFTRNSLLSRMESSDSECSYISNNSQQIAARPRRKKAPKNLQEPSLIKKLRRPK